MERDLGTHISEWDTSIKTLPSQLRESHGRGRKNVRARGDGEHRRMRPSGSYEHSSDDSETEASTESVQVCTRSSVYVLQLPG